MMPDDLKDDFESSRHGKRIKLTDDAGNKLDAEIRFATHLNQLHIDKDGRLEFPDRFEIILSK